MSTADLVQRLRAEMERQGLSIQDMASRLACTPPNVRQILSPSKSMLIATAERLAGALGYALELRLVPTAAAAEEPSPGSDSKPEATSDASRPRDAAPGPSEKRRSSPCWRPL